MRHYKLNPLKCTFAMTKGNFLGFTVHEHGIEVDREKAQAILCAQPPTNKKELQRLIGKVNFLRRFISNLFGKIKPFSPLLKASTEGNFKWSEEHQLAFDRIKKGGPDPTASNDRANCGKAASFVRLGYR